MKKFSLCLLAGLLVIAPACSKKEKKEATPAAPTTEVKTETPATTPATPVQPMVVEPEAGKVAKERTSGAVQPGMSEAKAEEIK
ncbi:TPA: hypothetical protein DDZ86_03005 [Candidatus Dependentiae bacterium]|nr:MAG: hypothetical protein UW09_C0001G0046 [candidate division TM6 bacterium GW2011_GWF2_43_87]HBL98588.1 hypothetical protein [Candidatus Dependentiae bacterium]